MDFATHVICYKYLILHFSGFYILSFQFPTTFKILYDFLFLDPPQSPDCYSALLAFYVLGEDIRLSIKTKKKIVYPTTKLTFWGLKFDNVCFQVRLSQDKLDNLKSDVEKFQNKKSAKLRKLQSLIGMLNFACNVVPYGRIFLSRLINLTAGLKMPYHHLNLTWKQGQI